MAPEMFSGQADRRSDVYSLGLTLYELLALRPAFDESDRGRLIRLVLHESPPRLRTLDPAIPRDLETIVQKSIEREPAHRYANAQALADDLQRYLADEPIRARPLSRLAKTARWCRRNVAITSLVSAVLVLVAAVAVGSTVAAFRLEQTLNHDRLRLAQTEFLRGQSLCDDGEVDQGLLWMARSLETAESVAEQDSEPWRRVIRMNLESYCRSAHARRRSWFTHPRWVSLRPVMPAASLRQRASILVVAPANRCGFGTRGQGACFASCPTEDRSAKLSSARTANG